MARLLLLSAALLAARAQEDGDVADAVEAEAEPAPAPSFLVVSKARPERAHRTAQHPAQHAAHHALATAQSTCGLASSRPLISGAG